jgi:hypothetical protein
VLAFLEQEIALVDVKTNEKYCIEGQKDFVRCVSEKFYD